MKHRTMQLYLSTKVRFVNFANRIIRNLQLILNRMAYIRNRHTDNEAPKQNMNVPIIMYVLEQKSRFY